MQPLSARDIETSVLGNLVYAALAWSLGWLRRKIARYDPRRWWIVPCLIVISWLSLNLIYSHFFQSLAIVFWLTSTALSALVLFGGLRRFWAIGLVGADVPTKDGVDYIRALEMCSSSLDFLGLGGSKLTTTNEVFAGAIDRCDSPNRPIRFLLSHPESDELRRIAKKAGRAENEYRTTVLNSLRVLAHLRIQRSKNIEVRFYQELPAFRTMFIDDEICLASHYVFGKGGDGSQLPQLHILKGQRDINSLYYGFKAYFDRIWEESAPWDPRKYAAE